MIIGIVIVVVIIIIIIVILAVINIVIIINIDDVAVVFNRIDHIWILFIVSNGSVASVV